MASLDQERLAGALGVTLLAQEDPFDSDVINGHASEAYRGGQERLVTFEVLLRNTSPTDKHRVSASNFHLFDDQDFAHQSLTCDSRARAPAVIESFLLPGTRMRGWVTFCLPWTHQAARLQFFTGHLGAGVVAFDLPRVEPATLAARRAGTAQRRARAEASRQLQLRELEVLALEARAEALREQATQSKLLEDRAARALQALGGATPTFTPHHEPHELDSEDRGDGEVATKRGSGA
jgi:hypothetical protein